jgi:hypothetical protein
MPMPSAAPATPLVPMNWSYTPPPNAPKPTVPDISIGANPSFGAPAIQKKIRYGPYRLPGVHEKNMESEVMKANGMFDAYIPDAAKPCDTCTLLVVNAGLEYFDGKEADVSTGAWLHHTVLMSKSEARS